MKYEIQRTALFKRDFKRIQKRGLNTDLLKKVVLKLANGEELPEKYRDHALTGNWVGYRECHILPDWLLVYKVFDDKLVLSLTRTGSHSDLDF